MNNIHVKYSKNPAQVSAAQLTQQLKNNSKKEVLLMLSGGSALGVLEYINTDVLSRNVTISVIDERFSMDPAINNFSQLEQTSFFDTCLEKGCAIIGTRIHKGETLPKAVMNFDTQLRRWEEECPGGIVIALLGLGEDAHTAGVLPFPESKRLFADLFLDEEWIASFDATGKNKHTLRFTTTLTFLKKKIDHAVVFASGEAKMKAFEKIADRTLELHEVPAKIFCYMKDVTVCTDNDISEMKIC